METNLGKGQVLYLSDVNFQIIMINKETSIKFGTIEKEETLVNNYTTSFFCSIAKHLRQHTL